MKRREFLRSALSAAALWPIHDVLANSTAAPSTIPARTLDGATVELRTKDIRTLAAGMGGQVLIAGQDGYEQARRVWNGMFDKHPALIARCASTADVVAAVTFAREHRLITAVRAGGHSVSGKSTCEGGIMIDVSPMQSVRVDPKARVGYVAGGALLGHLDRETRKFELVTTAGTVSHTGAAGLTLGGGLGRVGRRFGLACDNLQAVEIVTADGRTLRASEAENADLFWALRGGGGNFGVVTAFDYRLHHMKPTVLAGRIAWPFARAREVLQFLAEYSASTPDELNLDLSMFSTPDGAMITANPCWSADLAKGERELQALRSLGKPLFDTIAATDYVTLQSSNDAGTAGGRRYYAKSGFFPTFDMGAIEGIVDAFENTPQPRFAIAFQQLGGAIGRRPLHETAFPNRKAANWGMLIAGWEDAAHDEVTISSMRAAWQHIEPHTSGFYINAMSEAEDAKIAANYGENYPRLRQIKRKYDPDNQFRLNANIVPA